MEVTLWQIQVKKSDFKICKECGCFNWYEREECRECKSKDFREVTQKDIEKELKFWIKEGYTEEEADGVLYDV
ncbi:MAG: hypothetical protein DRM99_02350 [Thermoplasmata archaeon]|nr:MAG: hypothetical protein DRM99_02350 [Thermoplasmata archaeon]